MTDAIDLDACCARIADDRHADATGDGGACDGRHIQARSRGWVARVGLFTPAILQNSHRLDHVDQIRSRGKADPPGGYRGDLDDRGRPPARGGGLLELLRSGAA
jgi:hypothetical protein